ncbi:hypothetical protein NDU88_002121 [Pleurodeles waltl]|uniref:Uncharacterized protein n=1 Tax=Pleurodeles waltl TaxID=8319 RepID=A0AAV7KV86_PLEWA|nr:hypothetical protein NDU88_002121 [Pleurodeles waltl]
MGLQYALLCPTKLKVIDVEKTHFFKPLPPNVWSWLDMTGPRRDVLRVQGLPRWRKTEGSKTELHDQKPTGRVRRLRPSGHTRHEDGTIAERPDIYKQGKSHMKMQTPTRGRNSLHWGPQMT